MTRTSAVRLVGIVLSLLAMSPLLSAGVADAQSQGQITICHRTGSPTNPWVFMSIDTSTWPEHQAEGDVRANSLAECAPAAEAQAAPAVSAPAAPAPVVAPQQPVVPAQAAPTVSSEVTTSPAAPAPPAQAQVAPAQAAEAQVAPAQVAETQVVSADTAEVSSLPASGGEPDRPVLVLGLLALLVTGLGLRRLGRAHS